MKMYDQVMVLGIVFNTKRCDALAIYLGPVTRGAHKGMFRVRLNDVVLDLVEARLMGVVDYLNAKEAGTLPKEAIGEQF